MPVKRVHQGLPQPDTAVDPPPPTVTWPAPAIRPQPEPLPPGEVYYPSEDGNPMARRTTDNWLP